MLKPEQHAVDLSGHTSFGAKAIADTVRVLDDRLQCYAIDELLRGYSAPVLMLGSGSNVLFVDDFPGLIIQNRIPGLQIIDSTDRHAYVRVGAGCDWHETVLWTLSEGFSGIENLSLIPGTAGAAPIQNIGAYGVELSDVLDSVEVWDRKQSRFRMLKKKACELSYRDSVFKRQPERYFITQITMKLSKQFRPQLRYAGVREQLEQMGVTEPFSAQDVSDAITALRTRKLPDPGTLGNAGSFFKNPKVSTTQFESLSESHPGIVAFPDHAQANDQIKISAAWLIEQCGFKGQRSGDAGVYEHHALVLVNHGLATGAEVWALAGEIQSAVLDRFGIQLTPEPQIIGAE